MKIPFLPLLTVVALAVAALSVVPPHAPAAAPGEAPSSGVILDMNTLQHRPGDFTKDNHKVPAGNAVVVDGKFGKAVRFDFAEGAGGGFMTARVRPTKAWDEADGFSFWAKGDGSQS